MGKNPRHTGLRDSSNIAGMRPPLGRGRQREKEREKGGERGRERRGLLASEQHVRSSHPGALARTVSSFSNNPRTVRRGSILVIKRQCSLLCKTKILSDQSHANPRIPPRATRKGASVSGVRQKGRRKMQSFRGNRQRSFSQYPGNNRRPRGKFVHAVEIPSSTSPWITRVASGGTRFILAQTTGSSGSRRISVAREAPRHKLVH